MGLITEEVEIGLGGSNINHFEKLGYKIPKIKSWNRLSTPKNAKILVKILDLPSNSAVKIDVLCDCCGNIVENIEWRKYCNSKKDDKYYCGKCAKNGYKKWTSFKKWCINNNRQDLLDRWDYKLNKLNPNEVGHSSNKFYYFKCQNNIHESELKSINGITNNKNSTYCKLCNSFAQYLLNTYGENALRLYWDYDKNTINPWDISYGSNKEVWIKCQDRDYHGSYLVNCSNFSNNRSGCPYCNGKKVHFLDSLGSLHPESLNIWSDKNEKSPYKYTPNSGQEVWWKCPEGKHEEYFKKIQMAKVCEFRCPECTSERDESLLQEKVRLHLEKLNYNVLHEKNCTISPKNIIQHPTQKRKHKLKYDNEIIINDKHLIIEVHGIQHYEIGGFHKLQAKKNNTTPEQEFEYGQEKDKFKKDYAISKGYRYLEIPYWDFNNVEQILEEYLNSIKDVMSIC